MLNTWLAQQKLKTAQWSEIFRYFLIVRSKNIFEIFKDLNTTIKEKIFTIKSPKTLLQNSQYIDYWFICWNKNEQNLTIHQQNSDSNKHAKSSFCTLYYAAVMLCRQIKSHDCHFVAVSNLGKKKEKRSWSCMLEIGCGVSREGNSRPRN